MLRMAALIGERDLVAHNESYRRLWLARLLTDIPFSAMLYTMLLLVSNGAGSSFLSSLFITAYIAPAALLVTVSGAVSDHLPKAFVLTGSNLARAALCIVLALWSGSPWVAYVVAIGFAITSQFMGPASSSSLPLIVEQDRLHSANSLNNFGGLIAQAFGLLLLPPLFLHTVGAAPLAIVCAGLFAASAFYFFEIPELRTGKTGVSNAVSGSVGRFGEAWLRLCRDSVAYLSLIAVVLASVMSLVVVTLIPRYTADVLGIPAEYAIFVAAPAAIGVWLALRLAQLLSDRHSPAIMLVFAFLLLTTTVVLLGFAERLASIIVPWDIPGAIGFRSFDDRPERIIITVILAIALGFSYTSVNVGAASVIQHRVPHEIQGRIFSAQSMFSSLASVPPVIFAGIAADHIGVRPVFIIVGIGCAIVAIIFAVRVQALARLFPSQESAQPSRDRAPDT